MRTAIIATVCLLFTAPVFAEDVNLKWSLKEGDAFYATTTQEVNQKIQVMGQEIEQKIKMVTVAKFEVQSVKSTATVVKMTYTKVTMEGGVAAQGAGAITDRFKGASLTATFDKSFEITKLEGFDKFLDKLSDGDDMMRKLFKGLMPESAIRLLFTQVFVPAPGDKLPIGEKWTRTDKVPLSGIGELTNKTKFTLDSVKDGIATIKSTAETELKAGEANDDLPFKIKKTDLKSDDVKGTILFDTKAGRLKSSTTTMRMKGSMTMEIQNMEIEAKLDQTAVTKVEVTEKNPVRD